MENSLTQQKRPVTVYVDLALLEKLENWRTKQEIPPSKRGTFELAIREFLERRNG